MPHRKIIAGDVKEAKVVQVVPEEKRAGDMRVAEHVQLQQAADIEASTKRTAGQRAINAVWEITQAVIAISVTLVTLYVAGKLALSEQKPEAAFLLMSNAF